MIQKSNKRSTEEGSDDGEPKSDVPIKKEKLDDRVLHPMSYYADDRLELVKQIFSTLKPKTIRNLAPEHVRDESMETIEETVLNELLCMSTKRLRAIINATRCPSDTESAEDSDVEHKEQHVSLEEISSDSDIDGPNKQAKLKQRAKKLKKRKPNTANAENGSNSQISILELLELQARARAIRSQLALEPVTKIEVASDEEVRTIATADSKDVAGVTNVAQTETPVNGKTSPQNSENNGKRKIKLQRHYKQKLTTDAAKTNLEEKDVSVAAIEKVKRSQSPDVIPILAETETFVINDSTDDEGKALKKKKKESRDEFENKSETHVQIEESQLNAKETRLSEAEEGEILDEEEEHQKEKIEKVGPDKSEERICKNQPTQELASKEGEEPSISTKEMSEEATAEINGKKSELNEIEEKEQTSTEVTINSIEILADVTIKKTDNIEKVVNENKNEEISESEDNGIQTNTNIAVSNENIKMSYETDEDDIISLEGGDLEMIDLDEGTNQSTAPSTISRAKFEYDDDDVISLDSSCEETNKTETPVIGCWSDRYMKSAKVSKVLTASRLNRRVRDKLKAKNRESKAAAESAEKAAREAALLREEQKKKKFMSKHADGTIEQYKELLDNEKKLKRSQQTK